MDKKDKNIAKYFYFNSEINKHSCLIENCQKVLKIGTAYNLKRHLQSCHKEEYENIESQEKRIKIKKVPVAINKETYIKACVKLVTVNNLPFSLFDCEGFREITEPIEKAVEVSINSHNAPNSISDVANKIRQLIVEEAKNKLLYLKIDVATKFDRTILGINLQYLCDKIIKVRSIGIVELTIKHPAQNLNEEIARLLNDFSIKIEQIYSTTIDNGIDQTRELESANDLLLYSNIKSENDVVYDLADQLLSAISNSVRGATHTLQMAVHDTIKGRENEIQQVLDVVEQLKIIHPYHNVFSVQGIRKPFLDIVTRWNSYYDMIDYLVNKKEVISELLIKDENNLSISDELWLFMFQFRDTFKPIYIVTKKLKEIQLSMGDFYKYWLECELELEDNFCPMAIDLLTYLKERKKTLMDNNGFLAAIYMDPRFNYFGSDFLSNQDKERATQHMMNAWRALKRINQDILLSAETIKIESVSWSCNDTEIGQPLSRLESFLCNKDARLNNAKLNAHTIEGKIELLSQVERLNADENIFNYWYEKKPEDMEMYMLSQAILAVPASQVSVERAFSALELFLTENRTQMTETNLDNVLIIKLNSELLNSISITE